MDAAANPPDGPEGGHPPVVVGVVLPPDWVRLAPPPGLIILARPRSWGIPDVPLLGVGPAPAGRDAVEALPDAVVVERLDAGSDRWAIVAHAHACGGATTVIRQIGATADTPDLVAWATALDRDWAALRGPISAMVASTVAIAGPSSPSQGAVPPGRAPSTPHLPGDLRTWHLAPSELAAVLGASHLPRRLSGPAHAWREPTVRFCIDRLDGGGLATARLHAGPTGVLAHGYGAMAELEGWAHPHPGATARLLARVIDLGVAHPRATTYRIRQWAEGWRTAAVVTLGSEDGPAVASAGSGRLSPCSPGEVWSCLTEVARAAYELGSPS